MPRLALAELAAPAWGLLACAAIVGQPGPGGWGGGYQECLARRTCLFTRFCGRVSRPSHTCLQVAVCCYNKSLWLLPLALALLTQLASICGPLPHTLVLRGLSRELLLSGVLPRLSRDGLLVHKGTCNLPGGSAPAPSSLAPGLAYCEEPLTLVFSGFPAVSHPAGGAYSQDGWGRRLPPRACSSLRVCQDLA